MSIAIVTAFPGGSQDRYDAVITDLDLEHEPATGLIVHAAGPIEGGWRWYVAARRCVNG